jgi:ribulose-phosphate 3-epimerase
MVDIIPAIMPKSFSDLEGHAERVTSLVPLAQIDLMDGIFVEGKTWPYTEGKSDEEYEIKLPYLDKLNYEVDLMVQEPESVISNWIKAGVQRVIVHIESTKMMEDIINNVSAHNTESESKDLKTISLGIAINTTTPVESITPYIEKIDFVQCMGIKTIGKQGELFDERVIDQLRELRTKYPKLILSVDGAVHLDNAKNLVEAGANRLISGSEIFKSEDIVEKLKQFNAILR